ncbi:MAG: hypothetical protein EU530_03470 [Promethearchaeota archaeon]|nr:MAG: hypothetical protein EU530_03470 [Candidatus Lokiarchaeota archaeon]
MAKKYLKCKKCKYAFLIRQSEGIEKISCQYCGKISPTEEFEELSPDEYGNGYKLSLNEFKYVLRDASKFMIKAFFRKNIDIYNLEIHKKDYVFRDSDGLERTVEEVHYLIQTDIVLQRKFYAIYTDLYR